MNDEQRLYFKEWLNLSVLSEISRLSSIDSSSIELRPKGFDDSSDSGSGYVCEFKYGDDHYEVDFEQQGVNEELLLQLFDDYELPANLYRKLINLNIFEITFSGPEGFSLTGKSGSAAVAIYSKMLASIKKLMEVEDVHGLQFTAMESAMVPMYDRFFRQLLSGTFTQTSHDSFVRNDKLNMIVQSLNPQDQSNLKNKIADFQGVHQKRVDAIRFNKQMFRKLYVNKVQIEGKVIGVKFGLSQVGFGVVNKVAPDYLSLIWVRPHPRGWRWSSPETTAIFKYGKIASSSEINQSELRDFLDAARSEPLKDSFSKIRGFDGSVYEPEKPPQQARGFPMVNA